MSDDQVPVPIGPVPSILGKIKDAVVGAWQYLTVILVAVIGILLYYINLKQKKFNAMAAQVELTQTQKQADVLEADIKVKMQDKALLAKEVDDHQKALDLLEEKRKNLPNDNLTNDQINDIWNKKG